MSVGYARYDEKKSALCQRNLPAFSALETAERLGRQGVRDPLAIERVNCFLTFSHPNDGPGPCLSGAARFRVRYVAVTFDSGASRCSG